MGISYLDCIGRHEGDASIDFIQQPDGHIRPDYVAFPEAETHREYQRPEGLVMKERILGIERRVLHLP